VPQLDPHSFISQVFWLIVTFGALYWVLAKAALPRVAQVLEDRRRAIEQDLEKAEKFKAEADAALAGYTEALAGARRKAQDELRVTADKASARAAEAQAKLASKLADEVRAAETRIAAAQKQAAGDLAGVAAELAASVTERLTGARADQARIVRAVGKAAGEA
jgi:F-type H+-transporting ATPase subunit b